MKKLLGEGSARATRPNGCRRSKGTVRRDLMIEPLERRLVTALEARMRVAFGDLNADERALLASRVSVIGGGGRPDDGLKARILVALRPPSES